MRKPLVLLAVVLVLGLIPLSLAASWIEQDEWTATLDLAGADGTLTITPGAGSAWVDGGYSFAKTAKATRTAFKPLYNQPVITLDLWVLCRYATGVQYVVSQYVGTNDNVKIIFSGTNVYFDVGTGSANSNGRIESVLVNGSMFHIVGTWNKSRNSGKAEVFVNGTRGIATTGMTSNSLGNDQLYISGADGSTSLLKAEVHSLAIYNFSFTYSHVNATGTAPDVFFENASYYWTFNEGASTLANPALPAFMIQDVWAETLPTGEPWVPEWYSQEAWYGFLYRPSVPAEYGPMVNVWLGFLGLVMIPGGAAVFAKTKNYKLALIMIACGFALLIGTVV